jgi:hypothetical protein
VIKIDRAHIEATKASLLLAMETAVDGNGVKCARFNPPDMFLEKAVVVALNCLTMDLLGPHEIAAPSDVVQL